MTPIELLQRYADGTQPLVTFYDGPEVRVELSVASMLNAVAKASSMLRDGLAIEPGAVVSVDLPRHWQLPVWVMAALSAGAQVARARCDGVEVRVIGPAGLASGAQGRAPDEELLVSSCDTFGMPLPGPVPAGVIDIGLEVRGYPDTFVAEPQASTTAGLLLAEGRRSLAHLADQATAPPGARVWIDDRTAESALLAAVLEPVLVGGSMVIGVNLDEPAAAAIRAVESVTAPAAPSGG